jgi:hypothetical protein
MTLAATRPPPNRLTSAPTPSFAPAHSTSPALSGRGGASSTAPRSARSRRRASSSRASCATTSKRPATAASTRPTARARSTTSPGGDPKQGLHKAKTSGGLPSPCVVTSREISRRSATLGAPVVGVFDPPLLHRDFACNFPRLDKQRGFVPGSRARPHENRGRSWQTPWHGRQQAAPAVQTE